MFKFWVDDESGCSDEDFARLKYPLKVVSCKRSDECYAGSIIIRDANGKIWFHGEAKSMLANCLIASYKTGDTIE